MEHHQHEHCIIIGAMKCGTTSLFHSLSKNSSLITASKVKDTKFFVDRDRGGNWEMGLRWYLEMFPQSTGIKLEASTHYTKYPDYPGIPMRIKKLLKNVKLIYLVRDPLQRAISHFFHNLLVDRESLEIDRVFSTIPNKYLNYSNYAWQLSQYYQYFARDDILIINIVEEEYRKQSLEALKHFLGIENNSDRFFLENKNTIQENFIKAQKNVKIATKFMNSSENNIQRALNFGLSYQTLHKMIQICSENAMNFQKYYPFLIDCWLEKYQTYLSYSRENKPENL